MFVILLSDYRLAFLLLVALIVGAAVPLAFAWARVLPEEPPPFEISPSSNAFPQQEPRPEVSPQPSKRDRIVIVLLVFVTLSYAIQFPGFPRDVGTHWLNKVFPATATYLVFAAHALLMIITGVAACYSLLGSTPLRIPLGLGAEIVLLLWLLAPLLRTALLATS